MDNKKFWTLDKSGNHILRDLQKENENFTYEGYLNGYFDGNNYQWYEMFNHYVHGDNGCDYERLGCFIKDGDVVLDIGGNIGVFAHRAETRGASRVLSFEPLTPTYNCLVKNAGSKTEVYKLAVGDEDRFIEFKIHTDFTHIGGGSSDPNAINGRTIIYHENAYMINVNNIFKNLVDRVDFLKVDIEGGEVGLFNTITDENLRSIRCVSCEFHKTYSEFDQFQQGVLDRMDRLGFKGFTLYHGDGGLRTVSFWK